MTTRQQAPYGSWKSPLTSDLIVAESISLQDVLLDGDTVHWIEGRPRERGRYVVVRYSGSGQSEDLIPFEFNARTRVHEYGGGAALVADAKVYFTNMSDQRIYVADGGHPPQALTPSYEVEYGPRDQKLVANDVMRFADLVIDKPRKRLLALVEDHRKAFGKSAVEDVTKVQNYLAAIDLTTVAEPAVLTSGRDFYSSPRISPDGKKLAWLCWDHPNMPWVGTELWVADFNGDKLTNPSKVAGGTSESIFQPEWAPDGRLYFVSDRSGWWNLYRREANSSSTNVCPMDAEFGQPQWNFGMSTYAFLSEKRAACSCIANGKNMLLLVDLESGRYTRLQSEFNEFSSVRFGSGKVVLRAGSATIPASIVSLDPDTGVATTLRSSTNVAEDSLPDDSSRKLRDYFSEGKRIEFSNGNGETAFGIFFSPKNPDYEAPSGELPPLVVKCHGGPTSAASGTFDLRTQFWTSRGIAVIDVDYGGSTGYGREYRSRLHLNWGIVDVNDCAAAVRHLVAEKAVDGGRVVITGGSAGGYTTLACLTCEHEQVRKIFRAGASHYGVSDAAALARDTHKFESRYLDWLIAPYSDPDADTQTKNRATYEARSPVAHADRLSSPLAFFQGAEDKIVPADQTEKMVAALSKKGITAQYLLFAGEQHGFRQAHNIKWALDAELYFYLTLAFSPRSRPARESAALAPADEAIEAVFFDLGDTLGTATLQGSPLKLVRFDVSADALAVLKKVKAKGLKMGIISNTGLEDGTAINKVLAPTGLLDYFDPALIVYSGDVFVAKPNPEIFKIAAERAGLKDKPQQCLFVGDSQTERASAKSSAVGWHETWPLSTVEAKLTQTDRPAPVDGLSAIQASEISYSS
jgi:HAD superfamily hydrolase (TIGR01549 family)